MDPSRNNALVDLLDRMLDKGVVLHADIIITVSDIPLIGINLRAAIAGMKTMLDYGIMEVWDEKIRRIALEGDIPGMKLGYEEEIIYKNQVTARIEGKETSNWIHSYLYLTSKRLIVHRRRPGETPLELQIEYLENSELTLRNYQGINRESLIIKTFSSPRNQGSLILISSDVKTIQVMLKNQMIKLTSHKINAN